MSDIRPSTISRTLLTDHTTTHAVQIGEGEGSEIQMRWCGAGSFQRGLLGLSLIHI